VNLDKLKELAWTGIPANNPHLRAEVWRYLSDYIPVDAELKQDTLKRKRSEYANLVHHYFGDVSESDTVEELSARIDEKMSAYEQKTFKQIKMDVHRT